MMWLAQAPANIALIKYMGKKALNLPDNPSLSYTLEALKTTVSLELIEGEEDAWKPLLIEGQELLSLGLAAQARFLAHLQRLKAHFGFKGSFLIRSGNNFPLGSGLASSASSFAALTLCGIQALSELTKLPRPSLIEQASLSRLGSGSSCRSFFSPWALWLDSRVEPLELPYSQLLHQVIVVSAAEKKVSSSEAHQRVKSSPAYLTRSKRALANLEELLQAFKAQAWHELYQICWREFQDMHALFTSCEQPFTYMTEEVKSLLALLQKEWAEIGDGPIVTMDAGPNIHLLYRLEQKELAKNFEKKYLLGRYHVL